MPGNRRLTRARYMLINKEGASLYKTSQDLAYYRTINFPARIPFAGLVGMRINDQYAWYKVIEPTDSKGLSVFKTTAGFANGTDTVTAIGDDLILCYDNRVVGGKTQRVYTLLTQGFGLLKTWEAAPDQEIQCVIHTKDGFLFYEQKTVKQRGTKKEAVYRLYNTAMKAYKADTPTNITKNAKADLKKAALEADN